MQTRAYQIDLGRQVERPDWVMDWIPRHAEWGYNVLMLYLEDAFRFPSHPEFAQPHAWTPRQMEQVVRCADRYGVKVMPVVPALGHAAYFLKHPLNRHLGERRESPGPDGLPIMSGQVCPSLDESYAFLGELFRDVAAYCTAGYLHVSLDESFDLGVCSLCRKRSARGGHGRLFLEHLQRLHAIVSGMKLRMGIWGDMFYYFPEILSGVPRDVAVFDWYYYPFDRHPRVEMFNFRAVDSAGALRKAGLEVWASPNNGPFFCEVTPPFADRLRNIVSWWRYGQKTGCHALAITSWSPVYAGAELNCLVNAAAADLWLKPGAAQDPRTMVAHGLERMYGKAGRAGRPLADLLNRHQLAGYWRYQIVRAPLAKTAVPDGGPGLDAAVRAAAATEARAALRKAPPALRRTVALRAYYLQRERLSRVGATRALAARRAVQAGRPAAAQAQVRAIQKLLRGAQDAARRARQATQALWRSSRYPAQTNPLAGLIDGDLQAFGRLARSLAAAARRPELMLATNELLAARQVYVTVRCRRPCQQGLQVAIAAAGQEFKVLHTLYLLEFTADAGQPVTDFVHVHAIPLPDDAPESARLQVRFRASGLGEVDISRPYLLEGVRHLKPVRVVARAGRVSGARHVLGTGWTVLGDRAPQRGFPAPATFNRDHSVTVELA